MQQAAKSIRVRNAGENCFQGLFGQALRDASSRTRSDAVARRQMGARLPNPGEGFGMRELECHGLARVWQTGAAGAVSRPVVPHALTLARKGTFELARMG